MLYTGMQLLILYYYIPVYLSINPFTFANMHKLYLLLCTYFTLSTVAYEFEHAFSFDYVFFLLYAVIIKNKEPVFMREREFKVLQKQAYQYIKDQLNNETLKYNTIYSESKLALEMGISRTPVRDAVHRLYQEGLIDIIPNKGFALHKMTEKDVMEIYEVRSAIEGYCAQKAAETITSDSGRELLRNLQFSIEQQQKVLSSSRSIAEFAEHDQDFHNYLVCYSENDAFIEIFGQYMYKIKKLACYSLKHERRMEHTLEEHSLILSAIQKGDVHEAYSSTQQHMKAPLNINLESVYE